MGSVGGQDVEFVKPIEDKYVCPICRTVLQDAMQTECGHRFCSSCIEPELRSVKMLSFLKYAYLGKKFF